MKTIKGKTIWLTGASSGIGEALAYELAREGARLVLSARTEQRLEQVGSQCRQLGAECLIYPMDISKTEQLKQAVPAVIRRVGKIDILINNAGRSQRSYARETPLVNDRQLMEINFFGVVALSKLLIPHMLHNRSGHLVVVSSITGKFGAPMRTGYAASKHALQGYFEALRAELYPALPVTIVSPGRIRTNISLHALTKDGEAYNKMDAGQAKGMPADRCARKIIRAIKKERKEILIGRRELLMVYIRRFIPALYYLMIPKIKN